ncbi:MAG: TIR domain-containing protein [Candidatus Doudnabacteria bacterium]
MMRNIFYSFHFRNDVMRVQQIRNIGVIEANKPVTPNRWEEIKRGGDAAIRRWIDENIEKSSCVVVLIGAETHKSKWVKYEIEKAWNSKKGLVGIYIHNLRDPRTGTCSKGINPFIKIGLKNGKNLSEYISVYDAGSDAYNWIARNIEAVVEQGIQSKRN